MKGGCAVCHAAPTLVRGKHEPGLHCLGPPERPGRAQGAASQARRPGSPAHRQPLAPPPGRRLPSVPWRCADRALSLETAFLGRCCEDPDFHVDAEKQGFGILGSCLEIRLAFQGETL